MDAPQSALWIEAASWQSSIFPTIRQVLQYSKETMPGPRTELTVRLEPSSRQFFQWVFREKRPIAEIKQKMDELTQALVESGRDYNFVAEEKDWLGRSGYWNNTRKDAWGIKPHQRGRDLQILPQLANVPVWIEWGQDVGNWRNARSEEVYGSGPFAALADEYGDMHHNIGYWGGESGQSTANPFGNAGSHPIFDPQLSNADLEYDPDLLSLPTFLQPSHMSPQNTAPPISRPTFPDYTYRDQTGYQNSYIPQPAHPSSHLQYRSAEASATQGIPDRGTPDPEWVPNRRNEPSTIRYDDGGSGGREGCRRCEPGRFWGY